ncbi:protein prenyltransferase, alpha subunit [Crinalium epipsammum PCC 9333]|uniref:Protein prenyltransferase, alpha subunit n=1 Tax=Crinalium epipsammum PCC 9333 TaxID=1173022 RepID=K9W678_9CYAN|nr:CHAT domain-containing protein [Crinalium epipsammum]AFZ15257.1 protein prenyltransferase, alpha subunit [Crinalium epipsammum PCC 9333]
MVKALTVAEEGKNTCLSWLLYDRADEIPPPSYRQIQQLLNPTTAAIYWHISPYALHTFILKHNAPEPIPLTTPTSDHQETLPEPVNRQRQFKDWVKQWNHKYQEYSAGKTPLKQQPDNILPWREALPEMLQNLANILNIPAILKKINPENPDSPIENLILIPHRDLHRFPLHALFPDNFCITYLPSAQMGIDILKKYQQRDGEAGKPEIENNTRIFSVEHPNSQDFEDLPFAEIESATICQLFQNPTRFDSHRATKAIVETNLKDDHKIFSFTGHGGYNYRHPEKSALYLSETDQLTVAEICKLPLSHYYLVTLSACETAISGDYSITTEYVGLISGFMSAGVDHVVSTLWKVESEACALIMMKFYHLLRQTNSAPVALNQAKIWLREATWGDIAQFYQEILTNLPVNVGSLRPLIEDALYRINTMEENNCPFTDPYYWAAFTITGLPNQPYREII